MNLKDKVPPHNLVAEQATLGALLLDWDALGNVISYLRPERFYSLQNQKIFEAILSLDGQGIRGDIVTLIDEDGNEVRYYNENLSQYFEYKFYQYSDWKVLVTVELFTKNEQGEFVTNSPDGVVGKFYASTAILEKLVGDIDRLLNAELIDSSAKY